MKMKNLRSGFKRPIGLLGLGSLYFVSVLSCRFISKAGKIPECLEEKCNKEGVENAITAWGSNFFVSFCCSLFSVHLLLCKRTTRWSGVLALVFISVYFGLQGVLRILYPNNGSSDNKGMMGYFAVGTVANPFLALHAMSLAYFSLEATSKIPAVRQGCFHCCSKLMLRLWLAAIILTCLVNISGSLWCSTIPSLHTSERIDNYPDNLDFSERHRCIQLVGLSENFIWLPYALLWIPVGSLLRLSAVETPDAILGLSNGTAAILAIMCQWLGGSMYLVSISFASWLRAERGVSEKRFLEIWHDLYGTEVFHLGILLTMVCAHNLSYTLPQASPGPRPIPRSKTLRTRPDLSTPMAGEAMEESFSNKQRLVRFQEDFPPSVAEEHVAPASSQMDSPSDETSHTDLEESDAEKDVEAQKLPHKPSLVHQQEENSERL